MRQILRSQQSSCKPVVVQRDSNCLFSSPYIRCSRRMFGATADRSRCLQNGEKSLCTFRTNHANADSNTSKLFLFTPPPPPTELQNIAGNIKNKMLRTSHYLSSVEGGGVGWGGSEDFDPQMAPPSKSSDPFLPPLPTPR